ncbi:hypothetical protein [Cystobacter ferrugineus]|uniref:Type VI lipoprotein IgE-like C-terminal domain-containing protein n=1 Tax=Cystobacter ferrugineus TaxID=83449 RepID=A0A1L9BDE5_9BACT|nr:hypothetical protein [Cystobacter ferrugineus]OJH40277.1 hypothetical protein BON30_14640 [Cystobacter ferrugineus]
MKLQLLFYSVMPLLLAACQPATLQLRIKAPPGTNQGRPLYMLVRKVDPKQYAAESYAEVSARIVQTDPNLIHSEIIYPGTLRRLQVKVPSDSCLAVSFLFTAPDGNWQSFLGTPLPPSLDVELSEGRIQTGTSTAQPSKEGTKAPPSGAPAPPAPAAPPALPTPAKS